MKEEEREHFSEYYDRLQMKILWSIVHLRRSGIHPSSEQLDSLMGAESNRALRDKTKIIYANQNKG